MNKRRCDSGKSTLSLFYGLISHRMLGAAIVILGLVCFPCPASSLVSQLDPETKPKTLSPYFFVETGKKGVECFPLKSTSVVAVINGVIADVKVTQEYANTGSQPINARYIFPASTKAAVHGMRMTVGEDVVEARIKEREAAKKEFVKAKAAGKSASLLAQQRPNVFSMSVANIMPGDTVKVELHYSELLVPEDGVYSFVYPTVVGPRYSTIPEDGANDHDRWIKNPYLTSDKEPTSRFDMKVTLDAGLPIQQVTSSTHATNVSWDSKSRARVTLKPNEAKSGNRDFILDYRLNGDQIHAGLTLYQGKRENFFMLLVQPPKRVTTDLIPAREYIFVLDVSGSMHGFPLDTAKVLLRQLIGSLRPTDTFNVILFSGGNRVLSPRSMPASSTNVNAALSFIDAQRGGGGTELYSALKRGLSLPRPDNCSRTMVVITDGYISAERSVFELISENLNRCNVFSFGIGSSVNRYLIEGMARAGQGEPFVVTKPQKATSAATRFKTYVQAPVLTGVGIDFGTFDAYDVEPAVQADLFAQRPLVICGKWRGRPQGTIRLRGTTASGAYERSFKVTKEYVSETNSGLPYLWARTRLSRLSDFSPRQDDDDTRRQVIQLGLTYGLLTRYTSFVAVHDKVRNTSTPAKDVAQPLPLPKGVSNYAIGSPIATRNAPEPEISVVVALMYMLVLAILWRRRRHKSLSC